MRFKSRHKPMNMTEPTHGVQFEFDDDIVEAFTRADCWHLSQAMHRRGLPRIVIGAIGTLVEQADDSGQTHRWFGTHGLNLLPDGRFVDVTGIYPGPRALVDEWSVGITSRLATARTDPEVHETRRALLFLDHTPGFDVSRHALNTYLTLGGFTIATRGSMTPDTRLRPGIDVEWTADAMMHRLMLEGVELPHRDTSTAT